MLNIFIAPTDLHSGLTSISLALLHALDQQGIKASFFKPVATFDREGQERSTRLVRQTTPLTPPEPMALHEAQKLISDGKTDRLLEDLVSLHDKARNGSDVMIVEGLVPDRSNAFSAKINAEVAKALGAEIILLSSGQNKSLADIQRELSHNLAIYGGQQAGKVAGVLLNKCDPQIIPEYQQLLQLPLLGLIPWDNQLMSLRTSDVARQLPTRWISEGDKHGRRVKHTVMCARTLPNMLQSLRPDTLLVTPGDRDDIILACALAEANGTPLAGLLLTGGYQPAEATMTLCARAMQSGLPVLSTELDTYSCAHHLHQLDTAVPHDDQQRIESIRAHIAEFINPELLQKIVKTPGSLRLSPAAFRFQLVERSSADCKRIVLPEGEEPRTIQAAAICQQRGIAQCILLGDPEVVQQVAKAQGVELPAGLQIKRPQDIRTDYIPAMMELRKHKQLSAPMAEAQLEDNVVLGTMMLALDHVDGLVSGAIHTTANTIRPALQLIKTAPSAKLVSSVFFMCLPEQVLVYGDCAVNPDPNAEELADIAIQSADSALAMGIDPKVAMISYSTGSSGAGSDVEKVKQATELAKARRPDLLIDGPLQYDAATTASVARSKAPDSPVAGKATVLVFPDLNTGNTTYKAVQRSAHVISVGPMLQGLKKPVNDLSRGALVEDIVYTIALTSIQAQQMKS
jgi:phosphate acetyltransferase